MREKYAARANSAIVSARRRPKNFVRIDIAPRDGTLFLHFHDDRV